MEFRAGPLGAPAVNPAFWRGRRVFVTGHTGFKGSWLTLLLTELGAEVVGYALPPPTDRRSLFELASIADRCQSHFGDVRDLGGLLTCLETSNASVVLHLAAQALVRDSFEDPVGTYATNVMGTVNLLEAVRHCPGIEAVVVVTSDKCYENREWPWGYRENEAMGGYDPYSSSKGCAELVTSAYRRSFFSNGAGLATGRAGNVIGGGDYAKDRLIPDLLAAYGSGEPAVIRNPLATRPWQHVIEPLGGYLCLAERLSGGDRAFADGWNFGPDADSIETVSVVCDRLAERWGTGASWKLDEGARPHEAQSLSLDCSKARSQLGWRPKLSLDEALAWIVDWTREVEQGGDARESCLRQIRAYLSKDR